MPKDSRSSPTAKQILSAIPDWTPEECDRWLQDRGVLIFREVYRRLFNDALRLYRALPAAMPFHRSDKRTRIVVGSNQAGKTVSNIAEVARIVLGRHPNFPKRDGIALCVGLDANHIGQNMWHKLSQPGCFQLVPDETTGVPRAVRPDPENPKVIDPIDLARKKLWKPAPAFLPAEEWDYDGGIVWSDRGNNVPLVVSIRSTGWKMLWHPSGGNPRRGIDVNFSWFDEEIAQDAWYYETMPRLLKRDGSFLWSATPQSANEILVKLLARAEAGDENVEAYWLYLEDNPYISPEAKKKMYDDFASMSEEDLAVRYYGKLAILGRKVYPQFDMNKIGVDDFTRTSHGDRVSA